MIEVEQVVVLPLSKPRQPAPPWAARLATMTIHMVCIQYPIDAVIVHH